MANSVISTPTNRTIWAAEHLKSIQYDFRFAIPGFVLLLIWLPSFFGAIVLLITRSMTFGHMKDVLNHVSVGSVVVGTSALRAHSDDGHIIASHLRSNTTNSLGTSTVDLSTQKRHQSEGGMGDMGEDILVTLELDRFGGAPLLGDSDGSMESSNQV
ncbi:hypothetical protein P691DRAFT_764684 [Macrolepiota fuliginosa MF-IS2]|uniref:Uncharacterized protein n=1 Tax=Macrolepiota fuliginosa MF-IS2 TaxID=1400762 RepID=A0A9P6BYU1_9AGAR|nr:hypothetical protein P691DRAFT_764684 [Macrolepiota fuliginosa MF-IS2]